MTDIIIGASGFIGNSLYQQLKNENLIGTYFSRKKEHLIKLDMKSKNEIRIIFEKFEPKVVYMPAFIPGVDYCEQNREPCETNLRGIQNIVNFCAENKSLMVFFSSDYVFDGKSGPYLETDKPNPINEYGKIKLECEEMVKKLNHYLIIRTTVVYGYDVNSKNFLMTLYSDLKKGLTRRVPSDQIGSPTFVEDLSKITIKLVKCKKLGIFNVVGPDLCSRYVFALKIARQLGLNENLIIPLKTIELKQPAKRPLRAGLIIDKIRREIDATPLSVDQTLEYLKKNF